MVHFFKKELHGLLYLTINCRKIFVYLPYLGPIDGMFYEKK